VLGNVAVLLFFLMLVILIIVIIIIIIIIIRHSPLFLHTSFVNQPNRFIHSIPILVEHCSLCPRLQRYLQLAILR